MNLRCNHAPGCRPSDLHNAHVTDDVWVEVFAGTSWSEAGDGKKGKGPGWPEDGRVGQACCAQFAVSGERVRERPRKDYERVREWVLRTEMADAGSGRVMEFLWQVVFGRGPVFCPEEGRCYCDVYGRC